MTSGFVFASTPDPSTFLSLACPQEQGSLFVDNSNYCSLRESLSWPVSLVASLVRRLSGIRGPHSTTKLKVC